MVGTASARSFHVLAESVSDFVWTLKEDGTWDYCNSRWCRYTGSSVSSNIGLGWRRHVHQDDLVQLDRLWAQGIIEDRPFTVTFRVLDQHDLEQTLNTRFEPMGQGHWLATAQREPQDQSLLDLAQSAWSNQCNQGEAGARAGGIAEAVQSAAYGPYVTELSTAQTVPASAFAQHGSTAATVYPQVEALSAGAVTGVPNALPLLQQQDQGRWKFALEAADLGAWELDLNTGLAKRSLRHDQIFGYQTLLPEWSYDFFLEHVLPEDRTQVQASFERALSSHIDWVFECRINRADGERRWIRGTGRAIRDGGGRPCEMWGVIEDSTERKLAEQALRDREAHFRSLADTAPAMLWVTNIDHLCTFISRGWLVFTGQAMDEALGRGWLKAVHPDDRARVDSSFSDAARRRQPFQIECRLHTPDDSYRWVLKAGRPRSAPNGDFLGYVGSVIDIHNMKSAREEQQRTHELLHAVIDTTQDCVYVKDLYGRMRLANPAALRAIGKPADQVLGHSDVEWLESVEEGAVIEANDLRVMNSVKTEVVEERMTTASGSRLYVVTKSPLRNELGQVVGLVGIGRDVTEQKRVEQKVLESESRMRRLFDNAPANIAIFEGPEHRCVYVNSSHIRFFGERRCLGEPVREAFPEFSEDGEIRRMDHVFRTGDPLVTPHVETSYGSDSGRPAGIFHESVQPWFHEDGSVAGVMVMGFDITAEVELRREVEESSARFRALADNIAQLAWMADERGHIFWYNRRWLDYTGTTFDDMLHNRWENLHHPDHAQRVMRKVSRCLRTGEALEDTFPIRGGDGNYRWFYSQAIPIRDENGKVTRWFGTHTDVTEQRQAAQALEDADQRKNEFLAMLAHELRNPLAPVHYAVEILRNDGSRYEEQAKARDMIDRQVSHMSRLIDDLLDVSRITRGKIELRREQCDLASIVRKTVAEYRLSLEAANIQLACIAPQEPLWVNGDATRLIQAIGNLLHNAGKFTEPGGRVTVELCPQADAETAVLTVSDTGVGIESKLLAQLFEPFSQASQSLDRSKGGLGLGLSLVKGLTELHGGSVQAASAGPGQGATFTLRLPLLTAVREIADEPVWCKPQVSPELRVLIIEDNRDTAESLGTLLQLAGHQVDVAYDGPSGVELAKQIQPDVVLCDVGLPGGMDGYQVVRTLRRETQAPEPHWFALSGYGQEADRQQAREAGFDRHFVKPVDYGELSDALAAACKMRAAAQGTLKL